MFARLESQVDYNRNLSGAEPGELHLETPFVGKVKSEPVRLCIAHMMVLNNVVYRPR